MQQGVDAGGKKIGVLFVCLGNICRSPSAEAVFSAQVEKAGLAHMFDIDSCGTGGGNPDWYLDGGWSYHTGEPADDRMREAAARRGLTLMSRSRPLKPADLSRFDYVVGMEGKNLRAVQAATDFWASSSGPQGKGAAIPPDYKSRLSLMTTYCTANKGVDAVPDPYYGRGKAFEQVLDLLEDACAGLLDHIRRERGL